MKNSFVTSESGSSAVEFALVALPFFTLILVIFEISISTARQYMLDDVNFKVSRCSSLLGISEKKEDFLSNQICQRNLPFLSCDRVEIGASKLTNGSSSVDNTGRIKGWDVGASDDIVIIELSYPYEPIVPFVAISPTIVENGQSYLYSRSIIRNEPNSQRRVGGSC